MNPWREILKALQSELDRLSQEIDGCAVLPNGIVALLPAARFEKWSPILEAVAAELGQALVDWVSGSRRAWYEGSGPFLTLRLDADRVRPEITCEFLRTAPGDSAPTRQEPSVDVADGASSEKAEPPAPPEEVDVEPEPTEAHGESPAGPEGIDAGLTRRMAGAGVAAGTEGDGDVSEVDDGDFHLSRIELD